MNILIRTSQRPHLFRRCIESILDTGKDPEVFVSVDTQDTMQYAKEILQNSGLRHTIVSCYKGSGYGYWNLYLNHLLDKAKGWVLILDDDKIVNTLDLDLKDKNTVYVYRINYLDKILPEDKYWGTITSEHIDMVNFVFHTDNLRTRFDGKGRGDYRFIADMASYRKVEWVDKVIATIDQVNKGSGGVTPINIEFVVPYAFDKNLGAEYNRIFENTKADYVCLMDGDIMFLNNDFGHQIAKVIELHPDGGIYTCLTNRIGNPEQRYKGALSSERSITHHKRIADKLLKDKKYAVKKATMRTSMLLSVVPKKVWEEFKFKDGMMGVDWHFSSRVMEKYPVYIMQGLYIFHFYRLGLGGVSYTKHLV